MAWTRTAAPLLVACGLLAGCPYRGPLGRDAGRVPPGHDAGAPRGPGEPGRDAGTIPADIASPPLGGGTLIVLRDGEHAVAASPELDTLFELTLLPLAVVRRVALPIGSEAGRVVEDGAGRIHVVLRRGDGVATILPGETTAAPRSLCVGPRGVAWRESDDALIVACVDGTLVVAPAAGGPPTATYHLDADLRDATWSWRAIGCW